MPIDNDATARAVLVLTRESRRAREAAERVDLVTTALALRFGIGSSGDSPRDGADELVYVLE